MKLKYTLPLLLLSSRLYAYDFLATDKTMCIDMGEGYVVSTGSLFFVSVEIDRNRGLIPPDRIRLNDYGYTEVDFGDSTALLIPGENHAEVFPLEYYQSKDKRNSRAENEFWIDIPYRSRIGIDSITASSQLTETVGGKTIEYRAEYLLDRFFADCVCHPLNFNVRSLPWVEGVAGPGIGETLLVDFTEPVRKFSILNGYIDPVMMNLFRENSRLKEIRVRSTDGRIDLLHSFEDFVYFSEIVLPQAVKQIEIEILEAYPGSKYQDTCVSAIISRDFSVSHDIVSELDMWGIDPEVLK